MSPTYVTEKPVPITPSELRTMLAFVGLKNHRADAAVRMLAYLGTLNTTHEDT